jgi:hypothetical protein
MKSILSIIIISMGLFGCKTDDKVEYFPEKNIVIADDFKDFDNFFPIATIDLKKYGINSKLPLVYVFFDHTKEGFPKGDDIDHITFKLGKNGKLEPTFKKESLKLSKDYQRYLKESITKFEEYKKDGPESW